MGKSVSIFLCLILFICCMGCASSDEQSTDLLDKYAELDEKEMLETFNEMTTTEENPLSSENLIMASVALSEKAGNFTDNDLLSILQADEWSSITKITMIQLAEKINDGNGIADQKPFEELIAQPEVDTDVRRTLISNLDMSSSENQNMLEEIIRSEKGPIVGQSLQQIRHTDPKRALKLADHIIQDHTNYTPAAVKIAIMIKSLYFEDLVKAESKKDVTKEKEAYIAFCLERFNESQDSVFRDSIIFSLIDMQDFNAVKEVVNHPEVDDMLKRTCIDRNLRPLIKAVRSNPTKEDVEFIQTAMEIFPLKEMTDEMKEHLASNPEYSSPRLNNLIAMMETGGVPADQSRYENPPDLRWLE